jgi:hypothetical protein
MGGLELKFIAKNLAILIVGIELLKDRRNVMTFPIEE